MSTQTTRRPNALRLLATFAFALTLVSIVSSEASAQSGGPIHRYFAQFYGRDYYDGQRTGIRSHRGLETQYHGGFYGPVMIYDRAYGDQYGYRTDPGFSSLRGGTGSRIEGGAYSH